MSPKLMAQSSWLKAGSCAFALDRPQKDWLRAVILQRDDPLLPVGGDPGRHRNLALAFAVRVQMKLDDGKRVIDRSRTVGGLPELDSAVGHDDYLFAAVGQRRAARIVD